MNKIFFTLLVTIIAPFMMLDAQTSNEPLQLELDFHTKKFKVKDAKMLDHKKICDGKIETGDFYQLKISNINMNLFNVSIDKKDSTIVSNITFPTFDMIGLDAINSIIKGIIPTTNATETINDLLNKSKVELASKRDEISQIVQKLAEENKLSLALTKKNKTKFSTEKNYLKSNSNINILELEIKKLNEDALDIETKIKKLEESKKILEEIEKRQREIKQQMELAAPKMNEANDWIARLNNQALAYFVSPTRNTSVSQYVLDPNISLNKTFNEVLRISKELAAIKATISGYEAEYTKFKVLYDNVASNPFKTDSLVIKKDKELAQNFAKSISALDASLSKITNEKINGYFAGLIHLENNANREYISLPLQHKRDVSKIKIIVTPKKPEFGLQTYTAEYEFPKQSSYVGIGGAVYYAWFQNDVYSIRELKNGMEPSKFEIVDEGRTITEIGFSTLLHVGGKIYKNWLGLHGSIGPAISLRSKPQPRLSIGGGISLGKFKNMLSFNVLHMFGYVDRKSVLFEEGKLYDAKPENITISKLSNSWSLAIGYIYKF